MSLHIPFEHRVEGQMRYSLGDMLNFREIESLGFVFKSRPSYHSFARFGAGKDRTCVMAVKTGEFRVPRMDEWYLSGGQAWKARADFSTEYHILELCVVHRQIVTEYHIVDADVASTSS